MKKIFQIVMIFMISFNVFAQLEEDVNRVHYTGFIGNSPVEFEGYSEFETYIYSNYGRPIRLEQGRSENKMVYYEMDDNGKKTAELYFEKLSFDSPQLEGIWTDLKSKKQLEIKLVQQKIKKYNRNKEDDILIKKYIRKLEVEDRVEQSISVENEPEFKTIVKKILNGDKKLDKLYPELDEEFKHNWNLYNVYEAPDSAFEIFFFSATENDRFSTTIYRSFTRLKSGKIIGDTQNVPIVSIIKTGINTYMIISHSYPSSDIYATEDYYIEQFSILNNGIVEIPLINVKKNKRLDIYSSCSAFHIYNYSATQHGIIYLNYNPTNKKIHFGYARDEYVLVDKEYKDDSDIDLMKIISKDLIPNEDKKEILAVEGEFEITDGKITNFKEWYGKRKQNPEEN